MVWEVRICPGSIVKLAYTIRVDVSDWPAGILSAYCVQGGPVFQLANGLQAPEHEQNGIIT